MLRGLPGSARQEPSSIAVLAVCTGNICRSPYIAAELARLLPELRVESAGIAPATGQPPTEEIIRLLREKDPERALPTATARKLTKRLTRSAALIVAASHEHRVRAVQLDPTAIDRAFTLKELARFAGHIAEGAGLAALVAHAARAATEGPTTDQDDDLADPYGLDFAAYRSMAADVDRLLPVIAARLRPA